MVSLSESRHSGDKSYPSPTCCRSSIIFELKSRDVIDQLISVIFNVPKEKLRLKQRGTAPVAYARQVAMYMCHITYGASLREVGALFERDRTTVSHACQLVEESRDNPKMDWILDLLELSLQQLRNIDQSGSALRIDRDSDQTDSIEVRYER